MILSVTCAPVCCTTETSVVNMTKIFVPRLNGGDTLLSQAFLPRCSLCMVDWALNVLTNPDLLSHVPTFHVVLVVSRALPSLKR